IFPRSPNLSAATPASPSSRPSSTLPMLPLASNTTVALPQKLSATSILFLTTQCRSRSKNRSASQDRSFHGTIRFSWPHGNLLRPSPQAAPASSNPPSRRRLPPSNSQNTLLIAACPLASSTSSPASAKLPALRWSSTLM